MLLWTLLFAAFAVIFGAAALVWWQVEANRRLSRLMGGIGPHGGTSQATAGLLAGAPALQVEAPAQQADALKLQADALKQQADALKLQVEAPALPDTAVAAGAPASRFLNLRSWLLTMGAGAAGFALGRWLEGILGPSAPFLAAVVIGSLPRMARANSRDKKLAAMEEQFPDALEFLARSVRAGNAFSVGLELLAGEIGDPLKPEFLKLTREMALGAGLEEALYRLIGRVPLPEVRFFVAAVLLQRETGGNLGEVLGKLAVSVRERMQLRGKVRAASGQGRLTARVLTCLPVATMILLKLLSPAYIDAMTDSPVGRNLLAAAVVSQLLGYLAMQRIIRIEV